MSQLSPEAKLQRADQRAREVARAISAEAKADPDETEDEDFDEDARTPRDVSEGEDHDNKSDEGEGPHGAEGEAGDEKLGEAEEHQEAGVEAAGVAGHVFRNGDKVVVTLQGLVNGKITNVEVSGASVVRVWAGGQTLTLSVSGVPISRVVPMPEQPAESAPEEAPKPKPKPKAAPKRKTEEPDEDSDDEKPLGRKTKKAKKAKPSTAAPAGAEPEVHSSPAPTSLSRPSTSPKPKNAPAARKFTAVARIVVLPSKCTSEQAEVMIALMAGIEKAPLFVAVPQGTSLPPNIEAHTPIPFIAVINSGVARPCLQAQNDQERRDHPWGQGGQSTLRRRVHRCRNRRRFA
jgi:hypothetical protein